MKHYKFKRRLFAGALAAVMSVGVLAGCGADKESAKVNEEDPNTCPSEPYEINWYLQADPQDDVHSVEEKINEYLKDKLNVTVKINCLSGGQYTQKLGAMINANEYFDLCFAARWCLDYVGNSRKGAFVQLDDYLDTYLKDIANEYGKENLEYAKIDGKLCALPVYKEMVQQWGWVYRKDIADKYNIDMSKYKSFEELEPVIKMLKEKEPDLKYPLDWSSDTAPGPLATVDMVQSDTYLAKEGTPNAGKCINYFATDEYKKACETARDFYNKGYVRPDVLTATDQLQRMKEGKTFCMLYALKPGKAKEMFKDSAYEFDQAEVSKAQVDYLAGTGSMQAISASSKNPVRVMRFLNLLNTDRYLKNLVIHGIEGKHYNRIDDKTVEPIKGSGYDLYSSSWMIGNVFIDDLLPTEDPDKLTKLKEFNDSVKPGELDKDILTFCMPENNKRDILKTNINTAASKYKKQLAVGAVDTEPTLSNMLSELEKVGLNDYLTEIEKEFNEYRASKK